MKKHNFLLIVLCCMVACCLVGCAPKSKVDYSIYNFVGVQWIRNTECDETLCFLPNGEFRYTCACGNPVNDADVVESYSYDDTRKMFTLNCYEQIEGMITEIKLISCDGKVLELDFDGASRTFLIQDN